MSQASVVRINTKINSILGEINLSKASGYTLMSALENFATVNQEYFRSVWTKVREIDPRLELSPLLKYRRDRDGVASVVFKIYMSAFVKDGSDGYVIDFGIKVRVDYTNGVYVVTPIGTFINSEKWLYKQ